jgi:hypothetical protein
MTRSLGFVVLLPALAVIGCGPPRVEQVATVPVKGKVVLANGRAVTAGRVTFAAKEANVGGVEPFGDLKKDGTFDLMTQKPGDGAPVGRYVVWIDLVDYRNPPKKFESSPVPAKYRASATSDLVAEVKAGENDLTLTLK